MARARRGEGSPAFQIKGATQWSLSAFVVKHSQRSAEALFTEGCRSPSGLTNMEILKKKF
jgi:hypothetical protein